MPKLENHNGNLYTNKSTVAVTKNSNKQSSIQIPKIKESPARIPVLSFFTGGGLLDLGFMNAGFDIIWRNEFNPAFARGFEHAMSVHTGCDSHKINNTESIVRLTDLKIIKEAFGDEPIPVTFGIIGGPPCTDFSVAGKNHGGDGINGKLAGIYVSLILKLKPAFFVLENVKGLFDTRKHKKFLDELVQALEEVYFTDWKVLNALDYGVPQNRERGFLVGFRRDWLENNTNFAATNFSSQVKSREEWFPWPKPKYVIPKETYQWPSATKYGEMPQKPVDIPEDLMIGTYICNPDINLSLLPNGKDQFRAKSKKFLEIMEGDDTRKSFKRLHRWRFSPTAAYGNNEVHLHPSLPRRLSVREVMKIQSVPDTYELPSTISLTHKYKMIGNGVPVKLAEVIAGSFMQVLNKTFTFSSKPLTIEHQVALFKEATCEAPKAHELASGQIPHNGRPEMQISAVKSSSP